jgi:hypothetical protein
MRRLNIHYVLPLALLFTALPITAFAASADDEGLISYQVRKGDTLIDLGARFFNRPQDYRIVQSQNKIINPSAIPVGSIIYIPRNLLRFQPGSAKLISVRGAVVIGGGSAASQAKIGQIISEGARLSTSASSFVTLQLDDGSRVSLPSNSDLTIRRLRKYALGGSLDYDFDVGKGGARSTVIPLKSKDDRYRVRTPKAVSAVRGTDFQTRYDDAANRDFAEVVNGALAVGLGKEAATDLPAGKGLAVAANGEATIETLLPPPAFVRPGKVQADHELSFQATPSAGENGYRLTLATDAGFVDQIADIRSNVPETHIDGLPDGSYFLRVRAISAQGIEGNTATFPFKRRLNGVKGSAGKADDGYSFKWLGEGQGARRYHFQLFAGSTKSAALVDEAGLDTDRISISDLATGDYYWRVGAVQFIDGESATNWSEFEKLTIAP